MDIKEQKCLSLNLYAVTVSGPSKNWFSEVAQMMSFVHPVGANRCARKCPLLHPRSEETAPHYHLAQALLPPVAQVVSEGPNQIGRVPI